MSARHAAPSDWGFAAITTVCVIAALTVGAAVGTWLAVAGLTEDPALAARALLRALVIVLMAADVVFIAGIARRLHAMGGR